MENLEMLVRGLAVQSSSPGLGLPRSGSFQGLELLWVLAVATILFAVVSVTRVNVVTWGWSKSGGHVRVRVQSFTSLADGAIVTAGGVFSAEIVNCSADSCSDDGSSSSDCVSEHAEMLFIFDEKGGASLMTTTSTSTLPPSQHPPPRIAALEKHITPELPEVQKSEQQEEAAPVLITQPSLLRREGVEWDTSPVTAFASNGGSWFSPVWALPAEYRTLQVVKNSLSTDWDPVLRLRIRDAVLSNGSSGCSSVAVPLAPVFIPGSGTAVTLKDDVVRVWDSESKALTKSVRLSLDGCGATVTAFDVDWKSEVAGMASEGGVLSIANLEAGVFTECYHQTQQPLVQAIHLDTSSLSKTFFSGGPAAVNPGCSVSVWDYRANNRQLLVNLSTAVTIHGIRAHGQELFIRDGANTVAAHDMRKLGASPISRLPCNVITHASQDRWWDIDSTFNEAEEDEDDDFFDCLTSQETEAACVSSYVGSSIVRAMSRNFATKTMSH